MEGKELESELSIRKTNIYCLETLNMAEKLGLILIFLFASEIL